MSEHTAISWCDSTFNPWIGCTKVSPACDHCYAERLMDHRMHKVQWGAGKPRVRTSAANWRQPLLWERENEAFALAHEGRRRRVFCASLADVFDNEVLDDWRADLFRLIAATPHLDWLLLTKRIGNAERMLRTALRSLSMDDVASPYWPWPNVWLGATICNQEEADRDIPKLLAVPAAVRFLSIEPMLGPMDLTNVAPPFAERRQWHGIDVLTPYNRSLRPCLDWIICGGESGPQARPMPVPWLRSIVQQCRAAGVPVHVKQLGANPTGWCACRVHMADADNADCDDDYCDFYEAHEQGAPCSGRCAALVSKVGSDVAEWPAELRVQEFPA